MELGLGAQLPEVLDLLALLQTAPYGILEISGDMAEVGTVSTTAWLHVNNLVGRIDVLREYMQRLQAEGMTENYDPYRLFQNILEQHDAKRKEAEAKLAEQAAVDRAQAPEPEPAPEETKNTRRRSTRK